ncbi:hybrid sensor histidine kinase/response regulator [Halopenitus persicus]|uniref:histidine kinase n=1 Tax=Halopenitus persicus TaxID=1048396 RepID=A0A1H3NTD9_9EURY|nr:ATP-binding protein [Halopenitus persicus]SDY92023.1 PAS domain S-box-containing protein [Halopenitus persicus]
MPSGSWIFERFTDIVPETELAPEDVSVLLVDDDSEFATRLASFLGEQYGMTMTIKTTGEDTLEYLTTTTPNSKNSSTAAIFEKLSSHKTHAISHAQEPETQQQSPAGSGKLDCIVTDYQMPEMNGLTLIDEIREKYPALPVVMFAGQGSERVASEAFRRGADDYLQKDTDTEQFHVLATRIQTAVQLQRLSLALQTFYQAVDYAGHSIYITDTDSTILYVNPTFEEITGYTADEAIGQDPSLLKSGVHDEAFYADLWKTILAGDVWENEIVNERKNGEQYVVDQTIAPITNKRGEIIYFVAINNEITELRRRTRELQRQNERLEEFSRTLSHDLKNPLNVAQGRLDLAEQTNDDEQFDQIRQALTRMEMLTDEALSLAKHGLTVQQPEPVYLRETVQDAWDAVPTENATLECTISDGTTVSGDASRICELLENLFGNAVEHAGPNTTVRVELLDMYTGFYVADDGPGIQADERDTVFEPGYTSTEDGTGFGLAIVREIAAAHDWGIELMESEDGGARFQFSIPAEDWNNELEG